MVLGNHERGSGWFLVSAFTFICGLLLEDDRELKADDLLTYESRSYVILSVEQRQDEIAAVVFAESEYVGEVGPPGPV
jgi:hypothetical protein